MKVIAIIPARHASTRLPGKPLLAETGKPLIRHVVEAVGAARNVERVLVATDDERIARAVAGFGGRAVMTRPDHPSGTDRIAEAAAGLDLAGTDIIVNVQGDEPEMDPAHVDALVDLLAASRAPMATLAAPLDPSAAEDPACVKVVTAADGSALYFSRAPIPFDRDGAGCERLLHLGVYAYRKAFLLEFAAMPPGRLEQIERLEQLRALEAGHRIAVARVPSAVAGIDTRNDYAAFVARYRGKGAATGAGEIG
jgi:3-deoxy-manno-octulosonate cytidylyltransferase (CMP-KDO synthetase)